MVTVADFPGVQVLYAVADPLTFPLARFPVGAYRNALAFHPPSAYDDGDHIVIAG